MKITWFGQACFLIETDDIAVVTDPFDPKIGLTLPKDLKADIVTVSHQHMDHNYVSAVGGDPSVISTGGSTTITNVTFTGINTFHDDVGGSKRGPNIIFKFTLDGITIAHLGDLGHMLTDMQALELRGVDIIMIPVGGGPTINVEIAAKIIDKIQPKIVIPMHYGVKGLGFPLDPVELFTEKMALPVKKVDVLEVEENLLPPKPEVVILDLIARS
jgi:L-ascorbate metabolism protein UlaG (beta-lactamase superfamily)